MFQWRTNTNIPGKKAKERFNNEFYKEGDLFE